MNQEIPKRIIQTGKNTDLPLFSKAAVANVRMLKPSRAGLIDIPVFSSEYLLPMAGRLILASPVYVVDINMSQMQVIYNLAFNKFAAGDRLQVLPECVHHQARFPESAVAAHR